MVARISAGRFDIVAKCFAEVAEQCASKLACFGFVGSGSRDIDLMCVTRGSNDGGVDRDGLMLVTEGIRRGVDRALDMGIRLHPFASFRTQIYEEMLVTQREGGMVLPLHLLIYPGVDILLASEWPMIAKCLVASLRPMIPPDVQMMEAVRRLAMPPLQQRMWRYAALASEMFVLSGCRRDSNAVQEDLRHKSRYVVKYAISEMLYDQGKLTIEDVTHFVPSRSILKEYLDEGRASEFGALQEEPLRELTPADVEVLRDVPLAVVNGILARIT